MKKIRVFCLLLAMLLLAQGVGLPVEAAGETTDPSVQKGCQTIDAQVPLYGSEKMLETAQAAFLYEVNSGTTMYAWNPDEKLPPASIVKIVTCLLVLENCEITEKVTVTQSAMASISETAATLDLLPGEEFTVDQLLYALMVGSANDAAVVLAEYVAGSQDTFVRMMNDRIAELGCRDTVIVNAHGLHDDRQYTTARDVVRIVGEAMKNEQFMEYFGKTSYSMPASSQSDIRELDTTNYLLTIGTPLYYDSRVTGSRTGVTHDSKRSIVATAKSGQLTYIAVVLSASASYDDESGEVKRFGSYEEVKKLFDMGFQSHKICQVLYDGQILTQYSVSNGRNAVALGPVSSSFVAIPEETTTEDLVFRYGVSNGTLTAPVEAGQEITYVEVWYGSVCVAYSPLIAMNGSDVNDGSMLQENRYGGSSKVWVVLLIILIIGGVLVVVGFFGIRMVRGLRNASVQRRHKRRRSARRRTK